MDEQLDSDCNGFGDMDLNNKRQNLNVEAILVHLAIIFYGLSACYLYYRQTLWTGGAVFESDLPVHIRMVIVDGWYYSLTALVYKLLYFLPDGNLAIAIFLAGCTMASVYATTVLLQVLRGFFANEAKEELQLFMNVRRQNLYLFGGLALNFVMPCYVTGFSDGRYIGMQSASIWHNSTYIVMKPLAVVCVILYLNLLSKIQEHFQAKELLTFAGMLALTTAVKPSFLTVFAPVMLVFLLIDLIRGVPFGRLFVFGCCVLPSLVVILIQNAILFGGSTGEGWMIAPGAVLRQHSGYPAVAAALSVFFPLLVALFHWKDTRYRVVQFAYLMGMVGFAELFLFSETGKRAQDGNFMWGYSFSLLLVFTMALLTWWKSLKQLIGLVVGKPVGGRDSFEAKAKVPGQSIQAWTLAGEVIITTIVLGYHLYCGVLFYGRLLQGVSYYMWT